MNTLVGLIALFSVLVPQKMWFAPNQAVNITVKSGSASTLVLTDFSGKRLAAMGSAQAGPGAVVDIAAAFPEIKAPGTYVLFDVAAADHGAGAPASFLGTPLVIEARKNKDDPRVNGAMVIRVLPLCTATIQTDAGSMKCVFYYDVAPSTSESFLRLSGEGFYDGLLFHRIVPGFVVQAGDPQASDASIAGTGSPGFHLDAEFNDHPHLEGVLSMARTGDPEEEFGKMPGPQYANSAGSQFFICLNYDQTKQLDDKYTAFGRVVEGIDVLEKLGNAKVSDPQTGRPDNPPVISKITVEAVTADHDLYERFMWEGEKVKR